MYVVRKHPCLGTVIALDSIDVKKKIFLVRILFIVHTYLQLKVKYLFKDFLTTLLSNIVSA